jgi:hypothetical protein
MSIGRLLRGAGRGGAEERRRSPRTRCRLRCTLRVGRQRVRARVLDVSEGGLCLLSPVALRAKQAVTLQVDVPPHGPVTVEAVAWHVRKLKSGTAPSFSIGMMISKAGEGFRALLPGVDARDTGSEDVAATLAEMASRHACMPAPGAEQLELLGDADLGLDDDEGLEETGLDLFRVRVKAKRGPRTRTLTLSAASAVEAESLARTDLDDTWQILEVVPVEDPSA